MKSSQVFIIQPAVPQYRKRFFELLAREVSFKILCGNQSLEGASTVIPENVSISNKYTVISLLGGRLAWQKGVFFLPLSKGDIIVLSGNVRVISNILVAIRASLLGVKVIWWGQAWSANTNKLSFAVRVWISKKIADAFLVYTDSEIPRLVDEGISKDRVFALNNSVDIESIDTARRRWDSNRYLDLLGRYSLNDRRVILCVGRFTPKLGSNFAIKVIQRHKVVDPKIFYVFIGDGETSNEFDENVVSHGLESSVLHLPSCSDEEVLAGWFGVAKAFFYPGSVGLSLIHAMAYSLPCVLHSNFDKHMPEIAAFVEGTTGLSFSFENHDECVDKLNELICNEDRAKNMGLAGREIVRNNYTTSHMLKGMLGAIGRVRQG